VAFFLCKNREKEMAIKRTKWILEESKYALRQRDKTNHLKNQAYANKKAEEWTNSIVGQKFVLRLKK